MGASISSISVSSDNKYIAVGFKFEKVIVHNTVDKTKIEFKIDAMGSRFV